MNNLINILKKELIETFRDKKSLSMMLIIPIFIPVIIFGFSYLFDTETNKDIKEYNKIGFNYELSDTEKNIATELNIDYVVGDNDYLKEQYKDGKINLYVIKDESNYTLTGEESENTSYAISLMTKYYDIYKEYLQDSYLVSNNIDSNSFLNIITVDSNITEKENFYVTYLTTYGFLFIIMAITVSATYPATDTTAGERERKTLETLFTFPIKSRDIIVGKFLSVTISSVITGLISLILLIISLALVNNMFDMYKGVNLMLSLSSIVYAVIVIICYSFLISGLCIAIASRCKTFKEAQSALTPLTFLSIFPGMISFMFNIKATSLLAIIPFLNFTLLFQDISSGNVNILNIFLMLLSTIIFIAVVLGFNIKQYKSHKILF